VCLLTALLKMLLFILLLHALCPGWVLSLRHDRSCGCLKMIFGTRPHGHRPLLSSFVTFTPSSSTSTTLPQLNRLFETSFTRDENSASTAGVATVPTQFKVTQQILLHWHLFRDLKLKFIGSLRAEQLRLRSQQRVVATVEESVLRMEMAGLESQEEDAPRRVLFFKPMSWLGQIRPHRRDESWSASL
jgi:hypothetical protein